MEYDIHEHDLITNHHIYIIQSCFLQKSKRVVLCLRCEWGNKELRLMELTLGTGASEDSTSGGLPQYGKRVIGCTCVVLPTGDACLGHIRTGSCNILPSDQQYNHRHRMGRTWLALDQL